MDLFGKIMVILVTAVALILPFAVMNFERRITACEQLGGTLIKTPDGYVCFRVERITT